MCAYFEAEPSPSLDPAALLAACVENDASALLMDEPSLPPEFFDLSTGVAGELLHRLSIYHVRLAAVVSNPAAHSAYFQAFARESNRGEQFRFFATRQQAIDWLNSA